MLSPEKALLPDAHSGIKELSAFARARLFSTAADLVSSWLKHQAHRSHVGQEAPQEVTFNKVRLQTN